MQYIDCDNSEVVFHYVNNWLSLSEDQLKEIDQKWQEELKKTPHIFNGKHFSANKVEFLKNKINIYTNTTEYRYRIWAKSQKNIPAGLRPVVTLLFVYNKESDEIQLIRRSKHMSAYAQHITGIGGNVDFEESAIDDIWNHIKHIALKELEEEVVIQGDIMQDKLVDLGMVFTEEQSFLCCLFAYDGNILDLNSDENDEIIRVKRKDFATFVEQTEKAQMPWLEEGIYPLMDKLNRIEQRFVY